MSQFIPSMSEWKALPNQEDRRTILEQIRNDIGDKALSQTWDLTPNQYYAMLMRYKFSTKGLMEALGAPPIASKKSEIKEKSNQKKQKAATPESTILSERNWPKKPLERLPMPIIEPEYHVEESQLVSSRPPVQLPFPSLRGTPSQVSKQFEALALFLEALDEDANYEIHIAAVKM